MASYDIFRPRLKRAERGFQLLPNDKGNYNSLGELAGTNYGVSARAYEKVIGRPPIVDDMRNMSPDTADHIMKTLYWDSIKADSINSQAVAETFADHAINAGTYAATKIMQEVLNEVFHKTLIIDGGVGNKTISAINSVDSTQLFNAFSNRRKSFYNSLRDCKYFCSAWHGRVNELATDHKINIDKPIEVKKKNDAYCDCGYFGNCNCNYN